MELRHLRPLAAAFLTPHPVLAGPIPDHLHGPHWPTAEAPRYHLHMDLNPYAGFLAGQDPLPILASTASLLQDVTSQLSPAQASHPPAPGKWSIREIVSHLADCEIVFSFRLRQTLATDHPIIQPFDQGVWGERYAAYDLTSGLALFTAARNWNLELLKTVTEADRKRPVTHPERGTMTFQTIVETMAGHDINHLQQVERIVSTA